MWPFVRYYRIIQVGNEYAIKTWWGTFVDLTTPAYRWGKNSGWFVDCWSTDKSRVDSMLGKLRA